MKRGYALAGLALALAIIALSWSRPWWSAGTNGVNDPASRKKTGGAALRWTGGASRDSAPRTARVDPEVAVAGRVIDAIDRHPIEGAIVTLRTRDGEELDATVTDDAGAFAFDDAGAADVVAAAADGYSIHAKGLAPGAVELVLELDGAVSIRGEVVSPAGVPVEGAEVWVEDYERIWRDPPVVSSSVKSGADGRFEIVDAPSGTLIARAAHPLFAKGETRIGGVGPGRSREGVRVEMRDTGSVAGRVTRESGAAAAGAEVSWYAAASDRWRDYEIAGRTVADADGRFRLEHLPAGRGWVRAETGAGGGARPASIEVGRETSADVVVRDEAVFAGVVVDASGLPVKDAYVGVSGESFSGDGDDESGDGRDRRLRVAGFLQDAREREPGSRTGADGAFRLHAPVRGEARVIAQAVEGSGSAMAVAGSTSIRIVLDELGRTLIRITGEDGRPWPLRVPVGYRHDGPTSVISVERESRVETPVGELTVFLANEDEEPDASLGAPVTVQVARLPQITEVTLVVRGAGEEPANVRGRVVGPDGTVVAGARISIAGSRDRDWGGARGARLDWNGAVRSDSQGRFSVEAPRGEIQLFVYHPELRAEIVSVTVPAQGDADAGVIRMQAGEGASAIFEFSGIGAVLSLENERDCTVRDVVKDGPAERAGIRKDDVILEVDGTPLHGMEMSDVIERIRGPVGTTVTLLVRREGNLQPIFFEVVREKIRA